MQFKDSSKGLAAALVAAATHTASPAMGVMAPGWGKH